MSQSTAILVLNAVALGLGLLALLLPHWIYGKFEEMRNITVVKEVDSGLFKEVNKYYMKEDSVSDSDEIPGTFKKPEVVKTVKSLMITGLSLLTIAILNSFCRWCCNDNKTDGKTSATIYVIVSLMTLFSGGFILSGPLIFKNHVKSEFEPEKTHYGACWYLALISAILTFLVGVWTLLHSCGLLSKAEDKDNVKPQKKKKPVYFIT